eukprot:UN05978
MEASFFSLYKNVRNAYAYTKLVLSHTFWMVTNTLSSHTTLEDKSRDNICFFRVWCIDI